MTTLTVKAYGTPAPKGSKKHVGRGILVESSAKAKPWAEAVKHATLDAIGAHTPPVAGPVTVALVFTVRKPVSAPKRRTSWPVTRSSGDLDKLARNTLDALQAAGAFADDSQVVELCCTKVYPGEGLHALHIPGVHITVSPLPAAA